MAVNHFFSPPGPSLSLNAYIDTPSSPAPSPCHPRVPSEPHSLPACPSTLRQECPLLSSSLPPSRLPSSQGASPPAPASIYLLTSTSPPFLPASSALLCSRSSYTRIQPPLLPRFKNNSGSMETSLAHGDPRQCTQRTLKVFLSPSPLLLLRAPLAAHHPDVFTAAHLPSPQWPAHGPTHPHRRNSHLRCRSPRSPRSRPPLSMPPAQNGLSSAPHLLPAHILSRSSFPISLPWTARMHSPLTVTASHRQRSGHTIPVPAPARGVEGQAASLSDARVRTCALRASHLASPFNTIIVSV